MLLYICQLSGKSLTGSFKALYLWLFCWSMSVVSHLNGLLEITERTKLVLCYHFSRIDLQKLGGFACFHLHTILIYSRHLCKVFRHSGKSFHLYLICIPELQQLLNSEDYTYVLYCSHFFLVITSRNTAWLQLRTADSHLYTSLHCYHVHISWFKLAFCLQIMF